MNTEAALIRAILAAPRDPVPRLAYADWLEERADPRAEYLRLRVALDRPAETGQGPEDLLQRLGGLEKTIDPLWAALMIRGCSPTQSDPAEPGPDTRKQRRRRRERLEAAIGLFVGQYGRKARNDRPYDRKVEQFVKRMKPEELDRLMRGEE
jgi:uncharacterized protein (TIGR02996 family)